MQSADVSLCYQVDKRTLIKREKPKRAAQERLESGRRDFPYRRTVVFLWFHLGVNSHQRPGRMFQIEEKLELRRESAVVSIQLSANAPALCDESRHGAHCDRWMGRVTPDWDIDSDFLSASQFITLSVCRANTEPKTITHREYGHFFVLFYPISPQYTHII